MVFKPSIVIKLNFKKTQDVTFLLLIMYRMFKLPLTKIRIIISRNEKPRNHTITRWVVSLSIKCSHIEFPCTGIEKHFSQCKYFVSWQSLCKFILYKISFYMYKTHFAGIPCTLGGFEDDTFDNTRPAEWINMFNYKYYLHKLWERL